MQVAQGEKDALRRMRAKHELPFKEEHIAIFPSLFRKRISPSSDLCFLLTQRCNPEGLVGCKGYPDGGNCASVFTNK
jgi:hypothetical protein